MDCNKEEAKRARDIAEKKMQSRDFGSAKKLLIKALHLSPDIENVSHMLTVCDVHCSAGSLVNGQADHYGVLQVESTADEALIRKQYRRLALLLHPDKNKFAGAEAAFKLVGEAYKVLSDKGNRQVYDSRRRVQMRPVPSRQPSQHVRDARRYTGATSNASSNQYGGVKQHVQQSAFFASQTFWTMCIFCSNRFQYSRSWLNREVQCQRCFHKFHAFEVSPQNIPPPGSSSGISWSRPGFHHTDIPSQHSYNHGGQTHASNCSKPATSTTKEEKVEPSVDGVAGNQVKSENTKSVDKPASKPSSSNAHRMKNRRAVVNSSDSDSALSDSTDSDIVTEVDSTVLDGESTGCRYPRRSNRRKINVIYKEDESEDDDFVCPPKRLRKAGSYSSKSQDMPSPVVTDGLKMKTTEAPISKDEIKGDQAGDGLHGDNLPCQSAYERGKMPESQEAVEKKHAKQVRASSDAKAAISKDEIKGDQAGDGLHGDNLPCQSSHKRGTMPESKEAVEKKHVKQVRASSDAKADVDSKSRGTQPYSSISYPDTQFYDFGMDKNASKFEMNQIWAVYDDDDGFPRWYALIQKIFCAPFNLQYTWLEYNPTSTAEKAWADAGLPIACGNFKPGKFCFGKNLEIFSHLILCEKVRGNTYNIYPKRGEVWALFKEWDVGWTSAAEFPKKYDYEFVEVISDFAYGKDITVSHLVKVKGFRYLFMRANDEGSTMIPSRQLLKFSHRIPHYNICGEREGIPRDSFELDPAALPESFVNVTDSFNADSAEVLEAKFGDSCSKPQADEDKLAGGPVKNKSLRPSQSVFETASWKTRGSDRGNSDDVLGKSDQARERFYNFNMDRSVVKFEMNQIWAVYDEDDGMPRRYALIQKIFCAPFMLQYTWLEYNPTSTAEKAWVAAGLPIACGNFKPGKFCFGKNLKIFSHLILCEKVRGNTYNIYPKRREIWALFKEWDVGWSSAAESPKKYDYEFVEVISDFAYGKDISVSHLIKVKGFLYLFMRANDKEITMIPSGQLLKFSHRIPHYNICGEREGISRDSFELDPAALPESFVNVIDSFNANTAEVLEAEFGDPCSMPRTDEDKLAGGPVKNKSLRPSQTVFDTANRKTRGGVCRNSHDILDKSDQAREQWHVASEAPYELSRRFEAMEHSERGPCKLNADNNDEYAEDPTNNEPEDSEFYNFQEDKLEEKFKIGQVWALYSEIAGYPNYYALLKKANWEVNGFVIVKWLEYFPGTEEEKLWAKNGLPFGCGRFKVAPGAEQQDNTLVFSHMVNAKLIKNFMYDIYPNSCEVWAVFKNWSLKWTTADIEKNADYSVVEIIERDNHVIKALTLTKVKGYKYVFMPEARDAADIEIPINECLRFSHQIPAFRLTNQESGKLKDFWELDPDSIPKILLSTDP